MSAASFWLMGTTHCNSTVSLPTAMRSSASLSPRNSSMRMAFAVHFSGASGLAPSRAAVRRRPCSRCWGDQVAQICTPGPRFPRPGLLPAPSSIRREPPAPWRRRDSPTVAKRRAGRWRPAGKSDFTRARPCRPVITIRYSGIDHAWVAAQHERAPQIQGQGSSCADSIWRCASIVDHLPVLRTWARPRVCWLAAAAHARHGSRRAATASGRTREFYRLMPGPGAATGCRMLNFFCRLEIATPARQ